MSALGSDVGPALLSASPVGSKDVGRGRLRMSIPWSLQTGLVLVSAVRRL